MNQNKKKQESPYCRAFFFHVLFLLLPYSLLGKNPVNSNLLSILRTRLFQTQEKPSLTMSNIQDNHGMRSNRFRNLNRANARHATSSIRYCFIQTNE
jgi:hypothetical protein